MAPNLEYLIDRYLGVLDHASVATSDEVTRAELRRHRERGEQHLLVWRMQGRIEDLRERLRDELNDYERADHTGGLSGAKVEAVGREFANLCQAAGVNPSQKHGPS
jgi:hypothetical protein